MPMLWKKLVLVVDDDTDVLDSVADMLRQLPELHVQTAHSGHDALGRMRAQNFDLLVTDVQMPGMSGLELLQTATGEFPDTPVILMSGDADSRRLAALAGAYDVLPKPFQLGRLSEIVIGLLHNPTTR